MIEIDIIKFCIPELGWCVMAIDKSMTTREVYEAIVQLVEQEEERRKNEKKRVPDTTG